MVEKPKINVIRVLSCLRGAMYRSAEPVTAATKCVESVLRGLNLDFSTDGPYTIVSSNMPNSLYNNIVITHEPPGGQAKERLVKYMEGTVQRKKSLGIIVSDRLTFVAYEGGEWVLRKYPIDRASVIKMVEALRGLTRRSLYDMEEFGVTTPLAKKFTVMLYERLVGSKEAMEAYSKWVRLKYAKLDMTKRYLFPPRLDDEEFMNIVGGYGIEGGVPYRLVFALQTYIALLLKLVATETYYVYTSDEEYKSFLADLANGDVKDVYRLLSAMEENRIFENAGFVNFLDGNYFSWYLDVFDEELASAIADVAKRLANYEIATPQLTRARDLFWTLLNRADEMEQRAERVLDSAGLGNICTTLKEDGTKLSKIYVLDPVAGSGTVLLAYINRLRRCAEHLELTSAILGNVVGYTQDPLMAIAARTNWYLATADILEYVGRVEVPIYLAGLDLPFNQYVSLSLYQ